MAQRAIHSSVDVSLKKSGLANSLRFRGQVDIPVKAIQMVKKLSNFSGPVKLETFLDQ